MFCVHTELFSCSSRHPSLPAHEVMHLQNQTNPMELSTTVADKLVEADACDSPKSVEKIVSRRTTQSSQENIQIGFPQENIQNIAGAGAGADVDADAGQGRFTYELHVVVPK